MWHTNVYAKSHVFPDFKPFFLIILKYSGRSLMPSSPQFDDFFSFFCKLSCQFFDIFPSFQELFLEILPLFHVNKFIIFKSLSHIFSPFSLFLFIFSINHFFVGPFKFFFVVRLFCFFMPNFFYFFTIFDLG